MRVLDLFCGRLGWSRVFAQRGWHVTAIDLVEPPDIPPSVTFVQGDVMMLRYNAVPPLMPQGISKGTKFGLAREQRKKHDMYYRTGSKSKARNEYRANVATVPDYLANCIADYAQSLLRQSRQSASHTASLA